MEGVAGAEVVRAEVEEVLRAEVAGCAPAVGLDLVEVHDPVAERVPAVLISAVALPADQRPTGPTSAGRPSADLRGRPWPTGPAAGDSSRHPR